MSSNYNVQGIDLKPDASVLELCKASNASSGTTRSVLYTLVIVSVLAMIAAWNTRSDNWSTHRINNAINQLKHWKQLDSLSHQQVWNERAFMGYCRSNCWVPDSNLVKADSNEVRDPAVLLGTGTWVDYYKQLLQNLQRNRLENYMTVRVPLLGNSFDVNDIGAVSGIAFLLLLIVCYFTLSREVNNLQIAFISITARYTPQADQQEFTAYLKAYPGIRSGEQKLKLLSYINLVRRKYHYNFLSMNEVFTVPALDVMYNHDSLANVKRKGRLMRLRAGLFQALSHSIFMTPVVAHAVIIYNDYHTHITGQSISSVATHMIDFTSYVLFVAVTLLWILCSRKKIFITKLYNSFRRKGYRLNCNSVLKFKPLIDIRRQRAACRLRRMGSRKRG